MLQQVHISGKPKFTSHNYRSNDLFNTNKKKTPESRTSTLTPSRSMPSMSRLNVYTIRVISVSACLIVVRGMALFACTRIYCLHKYSIEGEHFPHIPNILDFVFV